ncbi:MAG: HDOD domain-containing protein, partial [Desulfomonilia bacterium]
SWLGPIFGSTAGNMLYTVGLLHDFGKIIFLQRGCYNNELKGVSSLKDLATEEEQTGLSHAEMGAYVAERWNLPEGIVDGLISHHLPGNARDLPSAVSLHAVDIMAHTGRLDVTMMNSVAAEFLRTSNGASLTAETIEEKYTDTAAKVKMLLDV